MKLKICISLFAIALALSGCGEQKKKTRASGIDGTRNRSESTQGVVDTSRFNSTASGDIGFIEAPPDAGELFTQALRGLVSATDDPTKMGNVSPVKGQDTWVRFMVKIKLNSDNTVNSEASYIQIVIKDDKAGQTVDGETIPPFSIYIDKAATGRFDGSSSKLKVTFDDAYGSITLDGQIYNSSIFAGQVDFNNKKFFDDSREPISGTLGGFSISVDGSISY